MRCALAHAGRSRATGIAVLPVDHPLVEPATVEELLAAFDAQRDADVVVLLGRKQDFVIGFCRPPHVAADAQRAKKAPGVPKAQDSLAGDTNLRMGWPSWRHSETVSKMIFTEAEAN